MIELWNYNSNPFKAYRPRKETRSNDIEPVQIPNTCIDRELY